MWVARDKNNNLKLFNDKPVRDWCWEDVDQTIKKEYWTRDIKKYPPVHYASLTALYDPNYQLTFLDKSLFPELKWEDEPIKVELVNALQYKNEKLAHEYMSAVYKEEHKDSLFTFINGDEILEN